MLVHNSISPQPVSSYLQMCNKGPEKGTPGYSEVKTPLTIRYDSPVTTLPRLLLSSPEVTFSFSVAGKEKPSP